MHLPKKNILLCSVLALTLASMSSSVSGYKLRGGGKGENLVLTEEYFSALSNRMLEPKSDCKDTEGNFKVKGTKGDKDCVWAGKKKKHCNKKLKDQPGSVNNLCLATCNKCPETEPPTASPTTESTINQKTDPPTVSPGGCKDTEGNFKVKGAKGDKNCVWAGKKNKHCNKKLKEQPGLVKELCSVSCDNCPETASPTESPTLESTINQKTDPPTASPTESPGGCKDTEGNFKVKGSKGGKNCEWAGKKNKHCNKKLNGQSGFVKKVCPVACDNCPETEPPTESPTPEVTINQKTDPPTEEQSSSPTISPTQSPTESPSSSSYPSSTPSTEPTDSFEPTA